MSAQLHSLTRIRESDSIVFYLMGKWAKSAAMDVAALLKTHPHRADTMDEFLRILSTGTKTPILFADRSGDLAQRRYVLASCMNMARLCVSIHAAAEEEYNLAHPTPSEGWGQIYRYRPFNDIELVWDALHNKKSDVIDWKT